ncbi:DUF2577 domain-containing protein [Bacillus piscicola]|uniref:DUF2577 domain-containing protein n=1 Tax=Bacillus piscicola TaxID=1632684 RepID=UPI001F0954C8|nr:DUF2577 domain-containing protein [Bacillus piscicola]
MSVNELVELMHMAGRQDTWDVGRGTVIQSPPTPVIKDNLTGMELDADDLVFSDHLTEHTREIEIAGSTQTAGTHPHSHGYQPTTMTVKSPLKAGDQVILLRPPDPMSSFVVIGKFVRFE